MQHSVIHSEVLVENQRRFGISSAPHKLFPPAETLLVAKVLVLQIFILRIPELAEIVEVVVKTKSLDKVVVAVTFKVPTRVEVPTTYNGVGGVVVPKPKYP